tara:strand:+ start:971 stop:1114 length:144 start_codon:yes stop_codon:yes gene_type:complete
MKLSWNAYCDAVMQSQENLLCIKDPTKKTTANMNGRRNILGFDPIKG